MQIAVQAIAPQPSGGSIVLVGVSVPIITKEDLNFDSPTHVVRRASLASSSAS